VKRTRLPSRVRLSAWHPTSIASYREASSGGTLILMAAPGVAYGTMVR